MLIIVGVAIDTMRQLEAQLLMRNYEGFITRTYAMKPGQHVILMGPRGQEGHAGGAIGSRPRTWSICRRGAIFRNTIKPAPSWRSTLRGYLDRGELVPDALTLEFVSRGVGGARAAFGDAGTAIRRLTRELDPGRGARGDDASHGAFDTPLSCRSTCRRMSSSTGCRAELTCPVCGTIYHVSFQSAQRSRGSAHLDGRDPRAASRRHARGDPAPARPLR
jgi:hypothetical protein